MLRRRERVERVALLRYASGSTRNRRWYAAPAASRRLKRKQGGGVLPAPAARGSARKAHLSNDAAKHRIRMTSIRSSVEETVM